MGEINCCCCIPIRAGVINFAVLRLIGGTMLVCSGFAMNVNLEQIYQTEVNHTFADDFLPMLYITIGIYFTFGLFATIMSVIHFKKVSEENIGLLKAWARISCIILRTFVLLLTTMLVIYSAYVFGFRRPDVYAGLALVSYGAIVLCILAFYISVVKRYSGSLEEKLNQGRVMENVCDG